VSGNRAKLEAQELPTFLSRLGDYEGQEQTRLGLELILRHDGFVTVEARFARWSEFAELTGPAPLWRISCRSNEASSRASCPSGPSGREHT